MCTPRLDSPLSSSEGQAVLTNVGDQGIGTEGTQINRPVKVGEKLPCFFFILGVLEVKLVSTHGTTPQQTTVDSVGECIMHEDMLFMDGLLKIVIIHTYTQTENLCCLSIMTRQEKHN